MANGEEHRWWVELLPWITGVFASLLGGLATVVLWIVRDRMAVQKKLDEFEGQLTQLLGESREWDGGHAHDRNIRDVSATVSNFAIEMRTEVRHLQDRLNRLVGWTERGEESHKKRGD